MNKKINKFLLYTFFSLSSNNINSAEQCSFNSQYQPQSKPILTITTNSSKKRDIEELKIKTQNDSTYAFYINVCKIPH